MMTTNGVGVRLAGPSGGMPRGHVGSDRER